MSSRATRKRPSLQEVEDVTDKPRHEMSPASTSTAPRTTRTRGAAADGPIVITDTPNKRQRIDEEHKEEQQHSESGDEDEEEADDADVDVDEQKSLPPSALPAAAPRPRRLASVSHPHSVLDLAHTPRAAAVAASQKLSQSGVIDFTSDDSAAPASSSSLPRRAPISMVGAPEVRLDTGRSTRHHPPVNYKEPTEASITRNIATVARQHARSTSRPTPRNTRARADSSDNGGNEGSSSRRGRSTTPPHRHANTSGIAPMQKLTREKAREMGVSFGQLQQMAGVHAMDDEEPQTGARRNTRHAAAAAAASTSPVAAESVPGSEEEESVGPRRRSGRSKRIVVDADADGDEYEQATESSEEEDDDDSEEDDHDHPPSRPRREASTRVSSYAEDKLAREALNRVRQEQSDSSSEHESRPQRGERVMTSYYREIKKDIIRLADGREVSERELRTMLRNGEQVRRLADHEEPDTAHQPGDAPHHAASAAHDGDVRRSTRNRQQVRPYTAGQSRDSGEDSHEEKQPRYTRPTRTQGNKGRRPSGSRRHQSDKNTRPVSYHDSSSRSSSSSSDSSDDNADRKDRRRTARDRRSIQPLHLQIQHAMRKIDQDALGAGIGGGGARSVKSKDGQLADIDPIEVDTQVDWSAIGGLDAHINALKEMVVLPLLYPDLFSKFKLQPPKGVLFFGPPGTGKTLVARALANTCSATGQKVSFFMRKGSDCLSKYVGEAERQLRLLFEQAHKMQPSIIFFDEIDGLAPVRSTRQDQIHASIVSTLLALMDGLDSRGHVIVIGATNRVDSIDPALRRPGRFDRELMFSLPNQAARRTILEIHTKDWTPRPETHFLHSVADLCVGYCGADLRALCTEATLRAVRRKYPQIYLSTDKLAIDVASIKLKQCDFLDAMRQIVPASHRSANVHARTIPAHLAPILQPVLDEMARRVKTIFPLGAVSRSAQANASHVILDDSDDEKEEEGEEKKSAEKGDVAMTPVDTTLDTAPSSFPLPSATAVASSSLASSPPAAAAALSALPPRPTLPLPLKARFLLHAANGSMGQSHLGPALLHQFEEFAIFSLDLPLLLGDANAKNAEESCVRIVQECKRNAPAVLYWPHIDLWWSTAAESLQHTVLMLLADLPPNSCIFLFATADCPHKDLPEELLALFPLAPHAHAAAPAFASSTLTFEIPPPTEVQLGDFLQPILNELKRDIPRMRAITQMPTLPVLPRLQDVLPSANGGAPAMTPEQEVLHESTLTPAQLNLKLDHEESLIRLQRMSLRGIVQKLLRTFPEFEYRVSLEEYPDYLDVVAQATSLQDILDKVNDGHTYDTVTKLLNEIDLLVNNCKEFSAHRAHEFRHVVNKACHMQDCALSMTSQLETKLVQQCEEISKRRVIRKAKFAAATAAAAANHHAHTRATRSSRSAETTPVNDAAPPAARSEATATPTEEVAHMEVDADAIQTNDKPDDDIALVDKAAPPSTEDTPAPAAASSPTTDPTLAIPIPLTNLPLPTASPPASLLPPPPPLDLSLPSLASLRRELVAALRDSPLDEVELVGFQIMKLVIEYQLNPNRNEAIDRIRKMAQERRQR